mgnify:CR=1 FL=1
MNQKGFSNIALVVVILFIIAVGGYFVFMKQNPQSSTTSETLSNYHSKELGLSFKYSSDLKVYQQNEDNVLIKADYKNPEHSGIEISMGIKRINPQRETKEQINFRLQGKKIIKQETKDNYEILEWEGGSQYYLLSDKGTFYVGDTVDTFGWRDIFQKEGLYQNYRLKFDTIRNSISFD